MSWLRALSSVLKHFVNVSTRKRQDRVCVCVCVRERERKCESRCVMKCSALISPCGNINLREPSCGALVVLRAADGKNRGSAEPQMPLGSEATHTHTHTHTLTHTHT